MIAAKAAGVTEERPDQVWSADITSVPLACEFMYLAATIDGYSRYVVAWRLSNTLEVSFCLDMLDEALGRGGRRCSTPTRRYFPRQANSKRATA